MRIDPRFLSVASTSAAPRPQGPSGRAFTVGEEKADRTGSARAAAPLATLDAILALQAEEDPSERRRRSARRGKDILDALDGLRAGLLAGRVSAAELGRLRQGLRSPGPSGDPALDEVVGQIELRAQVELAKLGHADLP